MVEAGNTRFLGSSRFGLVAFLPSPVEGDPVV